MTALVVCGVGGGVVVVAGSVSGGGRDGGIHVDVRWSIVVSVLDCHSRCRVFKSQPEAKFGSIFVLHMRSLDNSAVNGKKRRRGRGLATSPHMFRL